MQILALRPSTEFMRGEYCKEKVGDATYTDNEESACASAYVFPLTVGGEQRTEMFLTAVK